MIRRFFSEVIKKSEKTLRASHEKHLSLEDSGYYSNAPVTIDNQNNEIAKRVLSEGKISLNDKDLTFKSADVQTLNILGQDCLQSDLGYTKLYLNNQILLEDVDPKNIPKDKEIIFWAKQAKITAIGKPLDNTENRNIGNQIFHEKKPKFGAKLNWKSYLKLIPLLPVFYFFAIYLEVLQEYYYVRSFYSALDRENKELLIKLKSVPGSTLKTQQLLTKYYIDS